jgi:hypothetical protein
VALIEPDPEAVRLFEFIRASNRKGWANGVPLFGKEPASFAIGRREAVMYFDTGVLCDCLRETGMERHPSLPDGLPHAVRGLIIYPMAVPVLFTIEIGKEPWYVWNICCAFANQYERIFAQPDRYGVYGHYLDDLWIDGLLFFPEENLVHPAVSS